jgi:hypothetical protein
MPRKKTKNKNALQHGVYSSTVLLPGERRSDYEALRQSYFDEWVPDGVSEQCLVEDLCKLRWKKQRLDQYDQIRLQQRKDMIREENNADKLREELRDLAEEFSETQGVEGVEDILRQLSASINYVIHQRESRPCKFEQVDKWSFCLTPAIIAANRRDHEQTTAPEPLTGLQGEGGACRRQGRPDDSSTGRAF